MNWPFEFILDYFLRNLRIRVWAALDNLVQLLVVSFPILVVALRHKRKDAGWDAKSKLYAERDEHHDFETAMLAAFHNYAANCDQGA